MKSILITFDQAHYEKIVKMLDRNNQRGFTYWENVQGRGSVKGEPHYGSHAWPSTNSAIITVVEDEKVEKILDQLRTIDKESEALGLRAFVTQVEQAI